MQIQVGRRGDGRRGLIEDVAEDRDGLCGKLDLGRGAGPEGQRHRAAFGAGRGGVNADNDVACIRLAGGELIDRTAAVGVTRG